MKPHQIKFFLLAALATYGVASAQQAAQSPVAGAGASAGAAAAPAVQQAAQTQTGGVVAQTNPFTGRTLKAEELVREIERVRLENQLEEERRRGRVGSADAEVTAARRGVEVASTSTAMRKEQLAQAELDRQLAGLKAPPAVRPDAAIRQVAKKPAVIKSDDVPVTAPVMAPRAPVINVLSVLQSAGGKRSAMLEIGSDVVSVEDGQATPYGVVKVTASGVELDRRALAVSTSTLGRVRRSDAETVANSAVKASPSAIPRNVDANAVQGIQTPNVLPPLVLPPVLRGGMTPNSGANR